MTDTKSLEISKLFVQFLSTVLFCVLYIKMTQKLFLFILDLTTDAELCYLLVGLWSDVFWGVEDALGC